MKPLYLWYKIRWEHYKKENKKPKLVKSAACWHERISSSFPLKWDSYNSTKDSLFKTQTYLRIMHWDSWRWTYFSKQRRQNGREKDRDRSNGTPAGMIAVKSWGGAPSGQTRLEGRHSNQTWVAGTHRGWAQGQRNSTKKITVLEAGWHWTKDSACAGIGPP